MRVITWPNKQVVQGDTSQPVAVGINPVNVLDNATCEFGIFSTDLVTEHVRRAVTERTTDGRFRVYATSAETAALPPGTYTAAIKVENATTTPVFSQQVFFELEVFPKAL